MKNLIADVSRRMERIREAAMGAQLARHSREQVARASGGDLIAWDWDAYFNSGSRPGPVSRERVTASPAPRLRLVRQMNWDAYFNSGSTPSPTPQERSGPARIRAVGMAPGSQSAT